MPVEELRPLYVFREARFPLASLARPRTPKSATDKLLKELLGDQRGDNGAGISTNLDPLAPNSFWQSPVANANAACDAIVSGASAAAVTAALASDGCGLFTLSKINRRLPALPLRCHPEATSRDRIPGLPSLAQESEGALVLRSPQRICAPPLFRSDVDLCNVMAEFPFDVLQYVELGTNIALCGGAVLDATVNPDVKEAPRFKDLDLFAYGSERQRARACKHALNGVLRFCAERKLDEVRITRTSAYTQVFIPGYPPIQIVPSFRAPHALPPGSLAHVLASFEPDCVGLAWTGDGCFCTIRALRALVCGANFVRSCMRSSREVSREIRLAKFFTRGFDIVVPEASIDTVYDFPNTADDNLAGFALLWALCTRPHEVSRRQPPAHVLATALWTQAIHRNRRTKAFARRLLDLPLEEQDVYAGTEAIENDAAAPGAYHAWLRGQR